MSINHSYIIANDGHVELKVNISGLDRSSRDIDVLSAHIYASCVKTGVSKFTFSLSIEQLANLYSYLNNYDMIKDISMRKSGEFIQIKKEQEGIVELLVNSDPSQVLNAIKTVITANLSQDDINTILGRKDVLKEYNKRLQTPSQYDEPDWQKFFENNEWIFGYGLRYKYLSIIQRECRVSGTDLCGRNSVISDFLLSDSRFTKLVELKRPDTPLFKNKQNRSESWQLSNDLTDSISQILSQKASWEIKSQLENFDDDGKRIAEFTCDVDCILVIGMSDQFAGDDKDAAIKKKTIELYRRNMRNIEILFYDELLERTQFIVEGSINNNFTP